MPYIPKALTCFPLPYLKFEFPHGMPTPIAPQGRCATFDDLSTVDSDVHRNLITVKRCRQIHTPPHAI